MHNLESGLENETHKILWEFEIKTDHLISVRRQNLEKVKKKKKKKKKRKEKKRTHQIMDFVVPTDPKGKLKESEKRDKYLDLARELKILWDVKVMVIPVVIGALGTVTKGLVQGMETWK